MISLRTRKLALAIAIAERGWDEILSGTVIRNNPGDIMESGSLVEYPSLQKGWEALYHQIDLIFSGQSKYYKPDMSISAVAKIYVGTEDWSNWAHNVSSILGVSPNTPLNSII